MSIFRSRGTKKDGRQRLSKYVEGRDYVFAKVSNPKHLYSFQSHPRGLPSGTVLIEFKNLPAIRKKIKDQKKFNTLLKYKIRQCYYIFEENGASAPMRKKIDRDGIQMVPTNKKVRKAQKAKELQALVDLFPFPDPNKAPNEKSRKKRVHKEKSRQKKKAQRWRKKFSRRKSEIEVELHYQLRAQFSKTDVLVELQQYVTSFESTHKKIGDHLSGQLARMIGKNIFTPPKDVLGRNIPHIRVKASSSRCTVDIVDHLSTENWSHRSHVHRLLCLLMLHCSELSLMKHIGTEVFLSKYINLLRSPDELEREYVQLILIMIYQIGNTATKQLLSKLMINEICCFTSNTSEQVPYSAGTIIRSLLLMILKNSDVCGKEAWRIILPLYWAPMDCFVRYHQELFKCILLFISQDHSHVSHITYSLLRRWPKSSAFKQLSYLDQLFAIFLELVKRWEPGNSNNKNQPLPSNEWYYLDQDKIYLQQNICGVFRQLCFCIVGDHFDVSQAALRVLDHPAVFFPYIISPDTKPKKITKSTTTATTTTTEIITTKATKHGLVEYERTNNHFLPGVYKAFRRQVETHMYIEVRKTLDTLMGIMEKHWPTLCHQCVEEEEERILFEEERKAQKKLRYEELIQLSHEGQKKQDERIKQMKLAIKSQKVVNKKVAEISKWDVADIQEKRKRTWSLWDEGKRPMTRRGTCPLSFEQVAQQRKRKNSLELIHDKKKSLPKDLSNRGSLKFNKIEAIKAIKAMKAFGTSPKTPTKTLSPKTQEKPLSPKNQEKALSPKEERSPPSSTPVSPKLDQNTLSPKEEKTQSIVIDRDSESSKAGDALEEQKGCDDSGGDSSNESVASTSRNSLSQSQSQSQSLYSELFVNGAELSQLSTLSVDCSRIEVSQSFKADKSSDEDADLDLDSKEEYDEFTSQEIFSAARDAQLAVLLGDSSELKDNSDSVISNTGRLSVAETRLSFPETT